MNDTGIDSVELISPSWTNEQGLSPRYHHITQAEIRGPAYMTWYHQPVRRKAFKSKWYQIEHTKRQNHILLTEQGSVQNPTSLRSSIRMLRYEAG